MTTMLSFTRNHFLSRLPVTLGMFLAFSFGFFAASGQQAGKKAVPVIFETDMGNDVDDVLALDMLYKLQDHSHKPPAHSLWHPR